MLINSIHEDEELSTSGPVNPQSASPLFNRIPPEIRNRIFELALTAYDDKTKPYQSGTYYHRPGHRYAHKVDTNLLLTCRRIYAETKDIPASINPYTCWFHRAPPYASKNAHQALHRRHCRRISASPQSKIRPHPHPAILALQRLRNIRPTLGLS